MSLRAPRRRSGLGPVSEGGRFWIAPDGLVARVDAGATALLGAEATELEGRSVHEILGNGSNVGPGQVLADMDDVWYEHADGSRLHLMVGVGLDQGQLVLHLRDGTARHEARERVRRSERQLRRAQHLARIGSWTWDVEKDTITWSRELYELYGIDPSGFGASYEAYLTTIHEGDRERVHAVIQDAFKEAKSFTVRHRVVRSDGVVRHVFGQGAVETDSFGNTVRMYGVSQDVTDQVVANRTFEALLEAAPDAMVLADASGAIQFINQEAERMFGYTRQELVGRQVEVLMPEGLHRRHESHRKAYQEHPERRPMGEELDLVARRKDGSEFPAEISLSPLETEEGLVVTAAIRNTTERRRGEQEARERQARMESLLESALDAVVLTDLDGRIVEWNSAAEQMFGKTAAEALGHIFQDFAMPAKAKAHFEKILEVAHNGLDRAHRVWDAELLGAGGMVPVEASLARVDSGEEVFLLAVLRDITERRKAEESDRLAFERLIEIQQLREVNRFKTLLLNTASHELNTPMTPLRLQLHLLESDRLGKLSDRQKHSVEVLQRNVERLSMLIQDVLDVARLESGKLKMVQKPLQLNQIVHEAVDTFEQAISKAGLKSRIDVPEDLTVRADRNRMVQVLVNLVSNAIKFSPPGGMFRVEAKVDGTMVEVRVTDNGAGLEPAQIANLFQPFSQVHDLRRTNLPGTGLGLYISKGIIEQHGGSIGVDSAGSGKGASFWFRLPLHRGGLSPA